jgi:AcrR family transcriptional regulator
MNTGVKPTDGRRTRWQEHNRGRREELVDAALTAVRSHGAEASLDDVAAAAGVSKPVLYRHFTDRAALFSAVLERVATEVFLPRVTEALDPDEDEVAILRSAVRAFVELVVDEPQLYRFVFSHNALGRDGDFVASMEDAIAQALAGLMSRRLTDAGRDPAAAEPWAYGVVGMVQLATHRWVTHPTMTADQLVDHLVALAWGGLAGVLPGSARDRR